MSTPDPKNTPATSASSQQHDDHSDAPITADALDRPGDLESITKDDLMQILEDESEDEGGEGHFDPGDKTSTLTK